MSRWLRSVTAVLAVLAAFACRGRPVDAASDEEVGRLVDSLVPLVEEAVGLEFTSAPQWAVRDQEQLRTYLAAKLREQLPPETIEGLETAYRLFGFISDTLQLEPLVLDMLEQQVLGFYEPDSTTLFVLSGRPVGLTITVAHELVHALQDQYLPLDSLLDDRTSSDRAMARQAILEGQANYGAIRLIASEAAARPGFWDEAADAGRVNAEATLANIPLILREGVLFPYFEGARFMDWWAKSDLADTLPYGPRMPVSSEQILHPDRYLAGEVPVTLAFADSSDAVLYQDALGDFEIRVLTALLTGQDRANTALFTGWNGDLFRVYRSDVGPVLVWYTAWDGERHARRFLDGTATFLAETGRPGYRGEVMSQTIDGTPVVRVVLAPARWEGWRGEAMPEIAIQ